MKIAILQLNTMPGDIHGNSEKIISKINALPDVVDLVLTTELALLGYPPKDLLHTRRQSHT